MRSLILLIIGLVVIATADLSEPIETSLIEESSTQTSPSSASTSKNGVSAGEQVKILGCSFDVADPLCTLKYRSNGTLPAYSLTNTGSQTVKSYKITDLTSINAPTANGEVCQIPYSDAGAEYYHCRNTVNECRTTSGTFAKCANGYFQYAKPGSKLDPYAVEYLFPTIFLQEPGNYVAKFYILMFCDTETGCEKAQDHISLTVNDANNGNATIVHKEFKLSDLEMEKKWLQREVKFKIAATRKINMLFHLGRRAASTASNLLAFDQVELYHITGTTTTDEPTTTNDDDDEGSTTTAQDDEIKLLDCSFDVRDDQCYLRIQSNGTAASYSNALAASSFTPFVNYKITDVTSITAPTANGEVCQIPYSDAGVVYYHCRKNPNDCKTTSGAFSPCAPGKFHYSQATLSKAKTYMGEYLFPTINLPEPGSFRLKFYIAMFCSELECDDAEDFILLMVTDANDKSVTIFRTEYKLSDIEEQKKWLQREVKFKTEAEKIRLAFYLGRRALFDSSTFLAFDQVELYQIRETTTETTSATQQDSTQPDTGTTATEWLQTSEPTTSDLVQSNKPIDSSTTKEPEVGTTHAAATTHQQSSAASETTISEDVSTSTPSSAFTSSKTTEYLTETFTATETFTEESTSAITIPSSESSTSTPPTQTSSVPIQSDSPPPTYSSANTSTANTQASTTPVPSVPSTVAGVSLMTILLSVIAAAVVVVAAVAVAVYMKVYQKGCFKQARVHPEGQIEMK